MGLSTLIKQQYAQLIGGTAPSGSASSSGDISQMIKYLVAQGSSGRVHVGPQYWHLPATDFWYIDNPMVTQAAASSATFIAGLGGWGWGAPTSIGIGTAEVTADFMSSTDDAHNGPLTSAGGAVLRSPVLFGSYSHRELAGAILGTAPTKLCAEFWGRFTAHLAGDESETGFGFTGGNTNTAAACWSNAQAWISANATVFKLSANSGGTLDLGAARDTSWHKFKIVVDSQAATIEWFIDGSSQGTIALSATNDMWPACWGLATKSAGASRCQYADLHIWYE